MFNFHCHTFYCGHALNTPEEMIKAAIDKGFSSIGISEHYGKNEKGEWFWHSIKDPKGYYQDFLKAKEKYKDKIEILLGFEMDVQKYDYEETYKEILTYNPDYVLGSVHAYKDMFFSGGFDFYKTKTKEYLDNIIKEYLSYCIKIINLGYVNCLDHFDSYKKFYHLEDEEELYPYYKEIAKALRDNNVAIELNTHYFFEGIYEPDPNFYMLNLAKEYDIPVIVSSDAHSTEALNHKFTEAFEILKKIGIKTTCRFKNRQVIKEPFNP